MRLGGQLNLAAGTRTRTSSRQGQGGLVTGGMLSVAYLDKIDLNCNRAYRFALLELHSGYPCRCFLGSAGGLLVVCYPILDTISSCLHIKTCGLKHDPIVDQ